MTRLRSLALLGADAVRTGVTAILPHGGDLFRQKAPAAVYVGNGFGKAGPAAAPAGRERDA